MDPINGVYEICMDGVQPFNSRSDSLLPICIRCLDIPMSHRNSKVRQCPAMRPAGQVHILAANRVLVQVAIYEFALTFMFSVPSQARHPWPALAHPHTICVVTCIQYAPGCNGIVGGSASGIICLRPRCHFVGMLLPVHLIGCARRGRMGSPFVAGHAADHCTHPNRPPSQHGCLPSAYPNGVRTAWPPKTLAR